MSAQPEIASTTVDIGQSRNTLWIFGTFIGGALLLNAFVAQWIFESGIPEDKQTISPLCAMIGAVFLSAPLVWSTVKAVFQRKIHIGEMATLAIFACFATAKYTEAGLVAFFLLLAELLETRTALGARAAVEGLIRLTPREARVVEGANERMMPVEQLRTGLIVRVRPGENVPADGRVKTGESTINQASITGESLPADKMPGDEVYAGTVNLTGVIEVEITRVGADTTLGKVHDLILQAEGTRLPILRLVDQYVQWYVPTMLMIAAGIYYFTGDFNNAITALVVACPCALVLATPTAMVAGLSCAARLGILFKNVSHLESAADIDAVLIDKTGTLTTGQLTVTRLAPSASSEAESLLMTAASAERHSNHPVARALVNIAQETRVVLLEPTSVQEIGGKGVTATLDGDDVAVGRRSWLESDLGIDLSGIEEPKHDETSGFSTVYVARNGKALGWVGMMDKTRPQARGAVDALRELGVQNVTMLTGDRWGVARKVAGELGCTDVLAECLPEQKLELVQRVKDEGHQVMVVGDGVNDAPALAAGNLGVALGAAGNDVAIHSASIALMSDDLERIPFMLRLSRYVRRVVLQNLIFSVLMVMLGLIAAPLGWLTPVTAAMLHNVGSLIVIFNSAKIVRFGEEIPVDGPDAARRPRG